MGNSIGNLPMLRMPPSGLGAVRSSLNPNDPDYLRKMGLIGAIEGAHELKALASPTPTEPPVSGELTPPGPAPITRPGVQELGPSTQPDFMAPYRATLAEHPAVYSLMDRARRVGGEHPGILGHIKRGLAELGAGAAIGGEALGESAFPGVAARIPGTFNYIGAQRAAAFGRGLAEEKEAEESDIRRMMAQTQQERAETGAKSEASQEVYRNWQMEHGNDLFALNQDKENFNEQMGKGKLDLAGKSLDVQVGRLKELYDSLAEKTSNDQARNALMGQMVGIRQQAVDLIGQAQQLQAAGKTLQAQEAYSKANTVWNEITAMFGFGPLPGLEEAMGRATAPGQQATQVRGAFQPPAPAPRAPRKTGEAKTHSFTYNGQRYIDVPDALYKKYKGKPGFSE